MYIQNVFTKGVVSMAKTQAVNFRADSAFYQKTKDILADEKITVSDVEYDYDNRIIRPVKPSRKGNYITDYAVGSKMVEFS